MAQLVPVSAGLFQISFSQFVSYHNTASRSKTTAGAGNNIFCNVGNGIGSYGISSQMAHDNRIHGKTAAPDQKIGQNRRGIMNEILFQFPLRTLQKGKSYLYLFLFPILCKNQQKFHRPRQRRSQSRTADLHPGGTDQPEDQNCIQNQVQHQCCRTVNRTAKHTAAVFHHAQINLCNPHEQI